MIAVIMAGGLGTRLRPLTYAIPKPLLPVGEKPILEIIIGKLRAQGIREIHVTTGYRAELIKTYFGDGKKFGVRISYLNEDRPLGTAGALARLRGKLRGHGPFLVMNGDILTRQNFNAMRDFNVRQGAAMTIGAVRHTHKLAYGTLQLAGSRVVGIQEKPEFVYDVSAGIYVLDPRALRLIPRKGPFTMPDLANALNRDGQKVACYPVRQFWFAVEHLDHLNEVAQNMNRWI